MDNTQKEKELLEKGWKKETMCFHLQEYDETVSNKHRRMSYDIGSDFTAEQIGVIKNWANEVNNRFPNIKICITGTGYYMPAKSEGDGNN